MILRPLNLDAALRYLSKGLPPIKYSLSKNRKLFSFDEELSGGFFTTTGNNSEDANKVLEVLNAHNAVDAFITNVIRLNSVHFHSFEYYIEDAFNKLDAINPENSSWRFIGGAIHNYIELDYWIS